MIFQTIVEQTIDDVYRNQYNEKTGNFVKTNFKSLLYERGFLGTYGWLIGFGSPPRKHLDVLTITNNNRTLGSIFNIKIIGIFLRNDNDHKLIGIEENRIENDFLELPENERKMLSKIYPNIKNGEGWFGKLKANEIIKDWKEEKES